MERTSFIKNDEMIPDTHVFVYHDKEYPIKFDYFIYASNYFSKHQQEIERTKSINLIDSETEGNLNFTESTIQDFINFVQNQEIQLSEENAFGLNYLSNKYEVYKLNEITNEFIYSQEQFFVFDFLYLYENQKNCNIDHSKYEEMISSHIEQYVDDDRLLELEVPTIYRIIKRYFNKRKIENENNYNYNIEHDTERKVIEILFRYLDNRGKEGSVLFEYVEFGKYRNEYLKRLIENYSEIFNFQYINEPILEIYLETNEEIEKINKEKNSILQENKQLLSEIEQMDIIQKEYEKLVSEKTKQEVIDKNIIKQETMEELIKEQDAIRRAKERKKRKEKWIKKQERLKQKKQMQEMIESTTIEEFINERWNKKQKRLKHKKIKQKITEKKEEIDQETIEEEEIDQETIEQETIDQEMIEQESIVESIKDQEIIRRVKERKERKDK